MSTIWKYPLAVEDAQQIFMPSGAKILTVQVQKETPCLWVKVDPTAEYVPVDILTRGTGHLFNGIEGDYIGSYQLLKGDLVFHVFSKLVMEEQDG